MNARYSPLPSIFSSDSEKQSQNPHITTYIFSIIQYLADVLRPAITIRSRSNSNPRKQLRGTAYLDGLRGFAALLVYWMHHQLWPLREVPTGRLLENGYGYDGKHYFAALPFIRTFFTGGHFAVSVFFIISGYVLSLKPLTLIYAQDFSKLNENLSSALFRRWIRLHVPIILVTFGYMASWHIFGIWVLSPKQQGSFREEFWNWYIEFKNFSFIFRTGGEAWFTYNFPTWSIPVEFRGSIIIYSTLLAFSRASRNARLWGSIGLIFYFLYIVDGWFGSMFLAGMTLCELDILARNDNLPRWIKRLEKYKTQFAYFALIAAFYLSGVPSYVRDEETLTKAPGWYYLSLLKPQAVFDQKWFYLFFASIFLIWCIPRISWLRTFFETSFNQYLGKISFMLYLVHGPILWTLGDRMYCAVGWYKEANEQHVPGWVNAFPVSHGGPLGLEPAFLICQAVLLPLTLWVAEVTMRIVDDPTVKFSSWLYRAVLAPPPGQPLG
ncbi:acyltransferase family-domain-containing protein [Halenospora varia]|nr:acyltransferase family-domain-containing protein [Halenospora varia]